MGKQQTKASVKHHPLNEEAARRLRPIYDDCIEELERTIAREFYRGRRDPANDVAHYAFLRFMLHLANGEDFPENPRAFVFTIARNLALNAVRDIKKRGGFEPSNASRERAALTPSPYELALMARQTERLRELLSRLQPRLREVVELCDLQELTHEEAAQRLGLEASTVNTYHKRARRTLRRELVR